MAPPAWHIGSSDSAGWMSDAAYRYLCSQHTTAGTDRGLCPSALLPSRPPATCCRGKAVAMDVACALLHLHTSSYTHFDIKSR